MLHVVGVKSLDQLIEQAVPKDIRQTESLKWERPKSEREVLFHLRKTASKNIVLTSLIGQGYHGTVTPPAIQRNILESSIYQCLLYILFLLFDQTLGIFLI